MKKLTNFFFLTIILLILVFVYFVTYSFVEPKAYDYMTQHFLTKKLPFDKGKNIYGSGDIVLIVVDDKTAERYRWPWKRDLWCKILDYFNDFAEPRVVVDDGFVSTVDMDNPDSDRKYFESISRMNNFIAGFQPNATPWDDENFGKKYDEKFTKKYAVKNLENKTTNFVSFYKSSIPYTEKYFEAVKRSGSVFLIYGYINGSCDDEIVRTIDFFVPYKDSILPSIGMETMLAVYKNPKIILKDSSIEFPELNYKIRQYQSKERRFVPIRFYNEPVFNGEPYGYTHQKISAVDIMDSFDSIKKGEKPLYNPELFKDKIIIIGANVPVSEGLVDMKHSAIMLNHPGVDVQATIIDNVVHNDFLKVVPMWANLLIMLLIMGMVYFSIKSNELFKGLALTFTSILMYFLATCVCYYFVIVTLVITPIVMFIATMIVAYINRYLIESEKKSKVENALGKYMSEDVMKRVLQNIDNLGLGGKKATVTVLFSDIRGFTSMSEKLSAEEVTSILNEYFSEMEPIVKKYNGIINKFIGDAIMAIFGEPIQDDNHPANAVKCGVEMLRKVEELRKKWENEGKPQIEIGIGINTGEVFVGNIGSENRMEYTVIGDTVNLASRLESYNKTFNTNILISTTTHEATKDITEVRKIPDIEIRGKAEKLDVYEVLSVNRF